MSQTNRLIQSNGVDGEMYMYNVETERARRPEYELMMTLSGENKTPMQRARLRLQSYKVARQRTIRPGYRYGY